MLMEATVVQEVEKSVTKQKVASSIPCRSILEQDTEPLIAPDVQCAISVNVKCVYILEQGNEPLIAPDVQCAISVNVKCVYIVSCTYSTICPTKCLSQLSNVSMLLPTR